MPTEEELKYMGYHSTTYAIRLLQSINQNVMAEAVKCSDQVKTAKQCDFLVVSGRTLCLVSQTNRYIAVTSKYKNSQMLPNSKWFGVDASYINIKELNTSGHFR